MLFCQDKEIGVEAMERKRIEYIDWLRIISAIAVIGIHITMTQPIIIQCRRLERAIIPYLHVYIR